MPLESRFVICLDALFAHGLGNPGLEIQDADTLLAQ
jgi:hypothetical protein